MWRIRCAKYSHDRGRAGDERFKSGKVGLVERPPRVASADVARTSLDLTQFVEFLTKVQRARLRCKAEN